MSLNEGSGNNSRYDAALSHIVYVKHGAHSFDPTSRSGGNSCLKSPLKYEIPPMLRKLSASVACAVRYDLKKLPGKTLLELHLRSLKGTSNVARVRI